MPQDKEALVVQERSAVTHVPAAFTMQPTTLSEAMEYAKLISVSQLCPNEFRGKPQDVLIAVQMGAEVGISPMQALQNIAVINGRPCMWGDLVLALVQRSGLLESINERDGQEAWAQKEGRCEVVRKGQAEPIVRTFSYEMAEKAGLVKRGGPSSPWANYPGRMLQFRARSWALRDGFADVMKGIQSREEIEDYPAAAAPVAMPKRASEVSAAEVDRFIGGGKPDSGKAAPAKSSPPSASSAWAGTVKSVDSRDGSTKGKPWTLYRIVGHDGMEFKTFSGTLADFAREAGESKVSITFHEGDKGGLLIDDIGPFGDQPELPA